MKHFHLFPIAWEKCQLVTTDAMVDPKKAAEILKGFDTTCEFCGIQLESLHRAQNHYQTQHEAFGYIKCCGLKFRKDNAVADHIKWHVKPDIFRYKSNGPNILNRFS